MQNNIIIEIVDIFHFMLDLRQNFLMHNIVQMFYESLFHKINFESREVPDREQTMKYKQLAAQPVGKLIK